MATRATPKTDEDVNANVVTSTVGNHHMILDDDDFPPVKRPGRQAKETEESRAIDEYIANGARGVVIVESLAPDTPANEVASLRARLSTVAKKRGYSLLMRFENRPEMKHKSTYNHYVWKLVKKD